MMDYSKLKVTELKVILKERSLPLNGLKQALIDRLNEDDASKEVASSNEASAEASDQEGSSTENPGTSTLDHDGEGDEPAPISQIEIQEQSSRIVSPVTDEPAVQLSSDISVDAAPTEIQLEPAAQEPISEATDARHKPTELTSTKDEPSAQEPAAYAIDTESASVQVVDNGSSLPLSAPQAAQDSSNSVAHANSEARQYASGPSREDDEEKIRSAKMTDPVIANVIRDSVVPSIEGTDSGVEQGPFVGLNYTGNEPPSRSSTRPFTRTPSIVRKRKRRSTTPVPMSEEVEGKKPRLDSTYASEEDSMAMDPVASIDTRRTTPAAESAGDGGVETHSGADLQVLTGLTTGNGDNSISHLTTRSNDGSTRESQPPGFDDIPSLHASTRALYIRNLTRPLIPATLRNHLVSLIGSATSSHTEPDARLSTFYVDQVKTHCFAIFDSTSTARAVREGLHDRVWPDEKMRKALWVDYVDPGDVPTWLDREEAASQTRGQGIKKWEVIYDGPPGRTRAVLCEVGKAPSYGMRQVVALTETRQTPRGPAREGSDMRLSESTETQNPNKIGEESTAFKTLDELFSSTTAKPKLYFQPVDRRTYNRRLDFFDDLAKSKRELSPRRRDSRDRGPRARPRRDANGDELRKYTFEDEDYIVDNGPYRSPPPEDVVAAPPLYSDRQTARGRPYPSQGGTGAYNDRFNDRRGGFRGGFRGGHRDDFVRPGGQTYRAGYGGRGSRDDRFAYRGRG